MTPREYATGLALVLRGFLAMGVRPPARVAQFLVPEGVAPWTARRFGPFAWRRFDLREDAPAAAAALRAFRPGVVYGFPSHLALLAAAAVALPRPRLVVTHGEPLAPGERARIAEAFGAPVRQTYGCTELPRVAFECRAGTLHVLDDAVVVEEDEATRDGAGSADLLLTSLYPRALPLCRYRVGDRGRVAARQACACGRRGTVLASVDGRRDDLLRLPGGGRLSPRAVNVVETVPGVREFQLVQPSVERLVVSVVPGAGFDPETGVAEVARVVRAGCAGAAGAAACAAAAAGAGNPGGPGAAVEVVVQLVDAIPRTSAGKRRAVVSEVS